MSSWSGITGSGHRSGFAVANHRRTILTHFHGVRAPFCAFTFSLWSEKRSGSHFPHSQAPASSDLSPRARLARCPLRTAPPACFWFACLPQPSALILLSTPLPAATPPVTANASQPSSRAWTPTGPTPTASAATTCSPAPSPTTVTTTTMPGSSSPWLKPTRSPTTRATSPAPRTLSGSFSAARTTGSAAASTGTNPNGKPRTPASTPRPWAASGTRAASPISCSKVFWRYPTRTMTPTG